MKARSETRSVSPATYQRVVAIAGILLALIIFTGAAVRLTQSGLGCEDWPTCNDDKVVPEWSFHGWIEFGNRLISGLVGLATIAAVLAARWRRPYRADLMPWAWALVAGVLAQVILGGITVLVDLHPIVVSAHYLLSIVLMWAVIILWDKASKPAGPATPLVDDRAIKVSRLVTGLSVLVLVTGTIVTGTGPHSGDSRADRLALDLENVVRIHSIAAWVLVAAIVTLAVMLAGRPATRMLLGLTVAQGALGYLQYFTGVPAGLVQLHVMGSVAVFCGCLLHHLSLFGRHEISDCFAVATDSPTNSKVSHD